MTDIITLKLSTGEELISRVVTYKTEDDTIVLDRPNLIGLAANPDGQIAIQLMPWLASNQDGDEIAVHRAHIVAETKPSPELEKGYLKKTSAIALT